MAKYTTKKYMGDDAYSWAVFRDGRPVVTGCSKTEANYHKRKLEQKQQQRLEMGPDGVPFNN